MVEPHDEQQQYVPPRTLPPPNLLEPVSFPLGAVLFGSAAAIGLGIALFVASQLLYVYIIYNAIVGIGIGIAISKAIAERRKHAAFPLVFLTAACSILAYLTFNAAMMMYFFSDAEGPSPGFIEFITLRAQHEPFIGGAQIGAFGNYIVWTVEFLITWYYAWSRVSVKLRVIDVESVPSEVTEMIVHFLNNDRTLEDVRSELAVRGWSREEDQDTALSAIQSLASLMEDTEEEPKG